MRRFAAIARATALEIFSEPLSLLLLTSALALAVFAPAFHYHQFGDVSRMARDAGLSAMFLGGMIFAVVGAVRTFRREIESGTVSIALSHPVSRRMFFTAKAAGVFVACAVYLGVVAAMMLVIVNGAEIGGRVAAEHCDIARLWGPSYALGVAAIVVPYVAGAVLNRFGRFRFVLSAFAMMSAISLASVTYRTDASIVTRHLSAAAVMAMPVFAFAAFASAMAVRFRANQALSACALLFAAFVPAIGNYWMSDALSRGGSVPLSYAFAAFAVMLPAAVAFLVLGAKLLNGRDIS